MTLIEFLRARIAEDEDARSVPTPRILAECEVRRLIIRDADGLSGQWYEDRVLRALALPWGDHPDFREEWKP